MFVLFVFFSALNYDCFLVLARMKANSKTRTAQLVTSIAWKKKVEENKELNFINRQERKMMADLVG